MSKFPDSDVIDARRDRSISRRRFLQGSFIVVSGLTAVGLESRTPAAANNVPKQPGTTLAEVLVVANFEVPGLGRPSDVLDYARQHKMSLDKFLATAGDGSAEAVATGLAALDATWPHTILLGNLDRKRREAAVRYATGVLKDRPDLGVDRTHQPVERSANTERERHIRDQTWVASVSLLLAVSVGALQFITNPPAADRNVADPPAPSEPAVTTQEP